MTVRTMITHITMRTMSLINLVIWAMHERKHFFCRSPLSNKWNREKLSTYWHTVCKFKSGLTRTIANPLLQVCPTFYFCPSKVFTLCADHSQNVFSFKQTKNLILGWQTGKVFWKNISLAWSFNISICINAVMMEC